MERLFSEVATALAVFMEDGKKESGVKVLDACFAFMCAVYQEIGRGGFMRGK